MLPDEVPITNPGTLARKLSRHEEGMARVFAFMAQRLLAYTSVGSKTLTEVEDERHGVELPYALQLRGHGISPVTAFF